MKKKTKPTPQKLDINKELKVNDILLKHRALFLIGEVKNNNIEQLIKEIFVLDALNHKQIRLYINSPGGSVSAGFALIDTMVLIKSPIATIIHGEACSMGGLISIAGKKRCITKNAVWMAHDLSGGVGDDYSGKIEYRADYIKKLWKQIENHLKIYTKLSTKDIKLARNGELWLNPQECLNKGIVDEIL